MNQANNILNLCENCISVLKIAINTSISKEASIPLSQKLFLLETAFDVAKSETTLSNTYLESNDNSLKKAVEEFEKDILRQAIASNGSKRKAATALKMDHSTLIKKCQRYGI